MSPLGLCWKICLHEGLKADRERTGALDPAVESGDIGESRVWYGYLGRKP